MWAVPGVGHESQPLIQAQAPPSARWSDTCVRLHPGLDQELMLRQPSSGSRCCPTQRRAAAAAAAATAV